MIALLKYQRKAEKCCENPGVPKVLLFESSIECLELSCYMFVSGTLQRELPAWLKVWRHASPQEDFSPAPPLTIQWRWLTSRFGMRNPRHSWGIEQLQLHFSKTRNLTPVRVHVYSGGTYSIIYDISWIIMIDHALPWHSSIVVTPKTQSASVAQAGCHAFLLQIWFRHCIWASIDSLCSPFQPELTQRTDPAHHSSAFYDNLSVSVCVCMPRFYLIPQPWYSIWYTSHFCCQSAEL